MLRMILRMLSGILGSLFIAMYVNENTIAGDWCTGFGKVLVSIPLFMYALRGNNWSLFLFKNAELKYDGNDSFASSDFGSLIRLFRKFRKK